MSSEQTCPICTIVIDLATNSITLYTVDRQDANPPILEDVPAVLDMGQGGSLIGIEVGDRYFPVSAVETGTDALARSSEVGVSIGRDVDGTIQYVSLPRRGNGYEIAYPIGNQCWRQFINGYITETCVVTLGR